MRTHGDPSRAGSVAVETNAGGGAPGPRTAPRSDVGVGAAKLVPNIIVEGAADEFFAAHPANVIVRPISSSGTAIQVRLHTGGAL